MCPEAAGGGPESRPGFTKIKMLQKKIKIIIIIIIVVVVNRVCQLPPCTVLCILAPGRSILLLSGAARSPSAPAPLRGPGVRPGPKRRPLQHQVHGHLTQGRGGDEGKSQKRKRGGRVCRGAGGVRAGAERQGARHGGRLACAPAGRSPEQERRTLAAHPRSPGITKAENYKTKYKGGETARERAARCRAPAPCAPRAVPRGRGRCLPPEPDPAAARRSPAWRRAQAAPHTL